MLIGDGELASTEGRRGRLAIIGTGITAIGQMSVESLSHIEHADIVFYHATNGVTATQIRQLNSRAVDLYEYYDDGKERRITYVQMAELMLAEVRKGRSVVGVFHGHPGIFVRPARRALAIASAEGYETALLPAISSPDCLFADLRVDPGVFGCQIIMASRILSGKAIVASTGHVVVLQVSAVGDRGFSFSGGYKENKLDGFFRCLIDIYGDEHEGVYYLAAVFPGTKPEIAAYTLKRYLESDIQARVRAGMLYLPPKGLTFAELASRQAFRKGVAYGKFEDEAIAQLKDHETPPGFPSRYASPALFEVMEELGGNASSLDEYRRDPESFVARYPELNEAERRALRRRDPGALRKVTTLRL